MDVLGNTPLNDKRTQKKYCLQTQELLSDLAEDLSEFTSHCTSQQVQKFLPSADKKSASVRGAFACHSHRQKKPFKLYGDKDEKCVSTVFTCE